jgi:protocatechuate 4,5-dioxygenase alpha chain
MTQSTPAPSHSGHHPVRWHQARKGYALNKMCFSFNDEANRAAFLADEEGYMRQYGLNEAAGGRHPRRNVLQLIAAGGNAYYLAKFAGIFGLDMQDIGAQQTGMTKDSSRPSSSPPAVT